jgi:hypothetical protein
VALLQLQLRAGDRASGRHTRRSTGSDALDAAQPGAGGGGRVRTSVGLPTLPHAVGCFEVNCSLSLRQHLFCVSDKEGAGGSVAAAVLSGLGAGSSQTPSQRAATWVRALNYASHALLQPSRYEVAVKVRVVGSVVDDARRARAKGVLEETAYREAWVLSFLAALRRSGACPHFPLLLDTTRCSKLPAVLMGSPAASSTGAPTGVLPPSVPGARGIAAGLEMQVDAAGGAAAGAVHWHAVTTDAVQGDLARLLDSYKLPLLPPALLRGLLFQLIYALAVGRHAFGLHHNGLLSLSAVKLQQVPLASPAYRPYECYLVSPQVMAGLPVAVRRNATRPGPRTASGKGATGDPAFLWSPGGGEDACSRTGAPAAGGSASRAAPAPEDRVSWCVPASEVDGLRVVLHDFGAASLVRKQLEWWADGYAFPNTPWRDDLHDVAASLCGVGGERVSQFSTWAGGQLADLCNRMAAGRYSANPARALQHPVFTGDPSVAHAGYAVVADVDPLSRNLYAYTPATMAAPQSADNKPTAASTPPRIGTAVVSPPRPASAGAAVNVSASSADQRSSQPPPQVTQSSATPSTPASAPAPSESHAGESAALPARRGIDVSAMASQASMLAALTPTRPWIARRDATTVSIAWSAMDTLETLPSAQPAAFNLLLGGVSTYSGPDTQHDVALAPAAQAACAGGGGGGQGVLRFAVAAYYTGLGWTPLSDVLEVVVACMA